MPRRHTTWIVIADGSRARILTPREEGAGFDIVSEATSAEAHVPSREIWADRPGHTQESGSSARHSIEARHDPHEDRKAAFIHKLALQLNEAAEQERFDSLILFAPPRSMAELRARLDEGARRKITAAAPKDLTKVPLSELPSHLNALQQRS
ncbi:MAG TPA: host attachment protein [Stellaceae bacterium]|nr:host attachment protein [Stellaceae bacterium]